MLGSKTVKSMENFLYGNRKLYQKHVSSVFSFLRIKTLKRKITLSLEKYNNIPENKYFKFLNFLRTKRKKQSYYMVLVVLFFSYWMLCFHFGVLVPNMEKTLTIHAFGNVILFHHIECHSRLLGFWSFS